jgi:protein SCO1/2
MHGTLGRLERPGARSLVRLGLAGAAGKLAMKWRTACVTLAVVSATAGTAAARGSQPPLYGGQDASTASSSQAPEALKKIGLEQRLGNQVPLDLPFKDEAGRDVKLGDYFGKRPVVLTLVYYECPMLCTQVLNGLSRAIGTMSFTVGKEYEIVTVSFDPGETPALARAKKAGYIKRYNRPGAERGWHFLTGSEASIERLTQAVGFKYVYDPASDQYAHVSGIMVLTPDGTMSRYFYGIEYWPRDLRFSLIDASDRKIGSPVDLLLLPCFHYDPSRARYSVSILQVLQGAGALTLVGIVAGVMILRRRERRQWSGR